MALAPGQITARQDYAKGLTAYEDQRRWYSQKAGALKTRAQRVDLAIIGAGALVAGIPALFGEGQLGFLIAALGIFIAVMQGAQRIFRSGEIWPQYRQASEQMKSEARLFTQGVGAYACPEDEAREMYVLRLEAIIAGEQSTFFAEQVKARDKIKKGAT
ncbi:MAG: DUF4231 domain-containing protein [Pseudomonadota bacterium]